MRELQQLAGCDPVQPVDAGDAVTSREDRAGLTQLDLLAVALDLSLDNLTDLGSTQFHHVLINKRLAFSPELLARKRNKD